MTPNPAPDNDLADEYINQQKKRTRARAIKHYFFESVLLALLLFGVFAGFDYFNIGSLAERMVRYDESTNILVKHPWIIIFRDIDRYFLGMGTIQLLSFIAFYGTSFEFTPLSLIRSHLINTLILFSDFPNPPNSRVRQRAM
jgi:hypothetical protein